MRKMPSIAKTSFKTDLEMLQINEDETVKVENEEQENPGDAPDSVEYQGKHFSFFI